MLISVAPCVQLPSSESSFSERRCCNPGVTERLQKVTSDFARGGKVPRTVIVR